MGKSLLLISAEVKGHALKHMAPFCRVDLQLNKNDSCQIYTLTVNIMTCSVKTSSCGEEYILYVYLMKCKCLSDPVVASSCSPSSQTLLLLFPAEKMFH